MLNGAPFTVRKDWHVPPLTHQSTRTSGPISSVSVLGQRIVIVNSLQIAADLLDKRSAIYSDRPTLAFVSDCVGWCRAMVFRRYGPDFRTIRRLVHSVIGTPAAIRKFDRIEEEEVHGFLKRLLEKPENFADHISQ